MQLSVTFRHMESSEAVKEYANEKIVRIKKYFPDPIMAHVVLSTERGYQYVADVNIQLHNGLVIKGREITEDMYSSIDLVTAKIERQVRRYKERIRHHKMLQGLSEIPVAHHILQGENVASAVTKPAVDDHSPEAKARTVPPAAPFTPAPAIIKTSKFTARSMSVEEAIMQMHLMENQFLVFRNNGTGCVNVVYKRDDGNYGLIEAGPLTAPT